MPLPTLPPELERLDVLRRDANAFAGTCVWTQDPTDRHMPIKKWPSDKPYLPWVMEKMVSEVLFACVKHRRLMVTWAMCTVFAWDAMFYEERFNALICKKEEDSDDLVRRCKFVIEHIPAETFPIPIPRIEYKYCTLSFPETGSVIKGVAQGPDQLRQYTCSRIGGDEFAFWPQARQTFVAMKPTIEGGGKVTLISTRWPGFFKDLVEDTIDAGLEL